MHVASTCGINAKTQGSIFSKHVCMWKAHQQHAHSLLAMRFTSTLEIQAACFATLQAGTLLWLSLPLVSLASLATYI